MTYYHPEFYQLISLLGQPDGALAIQSTAVFTYGTDVVGATDLDRDGDTDLLLGHDGFSDGLEIHFNDGTAGMESIQQAHMGVTPPEVCVADVDGDGRDDIVACYGRSRGNTATVLFNRR